MHHTAEIKDHFEKLEIQCEESIWKKPCPAAVVTQLNMFKSDHLLFSDFKVTHKGASFYAFSIFDKFEVM